MVINLMKLFIFRQGNQWKMFYCARYHFKRHGQMYKLASNFQDFSDVQLFSEHRILQFLYHGLYIMAIFCVYVSN